MIDAAAIPAVEGDVNALVSKANELASRSGRVEVLGSVVDSSWRGLQECYRAPEAAALIAATAPVKTEAVSVARSMYSVATTLLLFAAEARELQCQLGSLRAQAADFVADVAGQHWQTDEARVREHNHLMARVDDAAAAWDAAQRRCANAINALVCGLPYRVEDGDGTHSADEFGYTATQLDQAAVDGGGTPWGTSEKQHHPWSRDTSALRIGLGVATGVGHAAVGLSTMVNVFKPRQLAASWANTAKLVIALNPNMTDDTGSWLFKPGEITATRSAFASSLIDADEWKTDPAKALGDNVFTVLSSVPTGGIGAGVKGLSKAGELSRVAEAGELGARATATAPVDTYVTDLVSPARRNHILYGEAPDSGGHMYPGLPGKTLFPRDWTEDKILHVISDIATDPASAWTPKQDTIKSFFTKRGRPVRFIVA